MLFVSKAGSRSLRDLGFVLEPWEGQQRIALAKPAAMGLTNLENTQTPPVFEPANHRPGSKNMLKQLRRRIHPNSIVAMLQVAISDVVYVAAVLLISSAGGASKLFALPGKSWGKLNMMDFTHRCSDLVFFAGAAPQKIEARLILFDHAIPIEVKTANG